ncbi:MAG: WecB/TagA/CpsF family glycosyltransferase [Planctomycetota bacterium]
MTASPAPASVCPDQGAAEAPVFGPRVRVGAVRFDPATEAGLVQHLESAMSAGRGGWMITSNLDHVRRAGRDPEFAAMLDEADLVTADGMPVVWASRLSGFPAPERVAGSSITPKLCAAAARAGRAVYLLGGAPGVAEKAAEALRDQTPGLEIAGVECPPMGFDQNPAEVSAIGQRVGASIPGGPGLVLVALGSPKQERLIRAIRAQCPGAWWVGVGITLSFLVGDVRRAPGWMQRLGLEWVHRLAQEPRRLFRRYLIDGLPFALWLFTASVCRRLTRRP